MVRRPRSVSNAALAAACVLLALAAALPASAQEYSIWDIQLGFLPENTLCYVDSVVVTGVGIYGYFVQEPNPHPEYGRQYSGIWVYTDQDHTCHKGDLVSVRAVYKEYYSSSELDYSAAGSQGLQVDLGQTTIPPPVPCTIGEINDTGDYAEAYEGVLVRVDRTDNQLYAGQEDATLRHNWPLHTTQAGGDTIFVYHENARPGDDFEYDSPDSGSVVTFCQGILQYNYNQYKIAPRSCELDLGTACKPKLRGAYATGPNTVNVQFGVEVQEASAENPANYELASGYLVLSAERDAANHKIVHLTTETLPAGDPEQIIVNNVLSESGVSGDPNQTYSFRSGITPIYQIQYVSSPGTDDASPLALQVVTVRGRVAAVEGNYYYLQDDNGGVWDGLYCRVAKSGPVQVGDDVQVAGEVYEYYNLTELRFKPGIDHFRNFGPSQTPVNVSNVTTPQIRYRDTAKSAEPYEDCLVKLSSATIQDSIPGVAGPYYGEWLLRQTAYPDTAGMDLAGLFNNDRTRMVSYDPCPGNIINVTGILRYDYSQYRIGPRTGRGNDIIEIYHVSGCAQTGVEDEAAMPSLALRQNAPNPFHQGTVIGFSLPRNGRVQLEVMDVSGRLVRTLASAPMPAGEHRYQWDGRNEAGHPVAAGAYFYRLRVDGEEQSRKMVLLD